jgi:Mor family transcriptional regulator
MLCQEPNLKDYIGSCNTLTKFYSGLCIKSIKIEEGKTLKYIKANNVLPEEIIKVIQEYVDGEFLYIPRKDENQKAWGEKSGIKNVLKNRNNEIFHKYSKGITIKKLAEMYYLSEQSVRRIVNEQKRSCL